jgi:exodeoxyribonuclease VII large subunit
MGMKTEEQSDPSTGEITDLSGSNSGEYSVSSLSKAVKRTIENAFGLLRVRGEISGYRGPHASGHCYFALKDEGAKIDAVIWRGLFPKLRSRLQEGLEVIITGKVSSYPGKSAYQLIVENVEPAGAGAMMALLDERRRKLAAEGLFDAARKRPLPYLPRRIGVVTSPTGAVIRDILHRLSERFPCHVLVWPVRVQGETAAAEVAAAIRGFNEVENGPELLIIARGGGSLEDLWPFNDEDVVRAVSTSRIPVISAIGHESDTTLIDHVADRRAPTPTAAAEIAVPVRRDLVSVLATVDARLTRAEARLVNELGVRLSSLARVLPKPDEVLASVQQRLDIASQRLPAGLVLNYSKHQLNFASARGKLSLRVLQQTASVAGRQLTDLRERCRRLATLGILNKRESFAAKVKLLEALSYRSVLARGFALVRDKTGRTLRNAAAVKPGSAMVLEFADGAIEAFAGPKQTELFSSKPGL